ncbi:MAG TPA: hypothetical protein VEA40_12490 [Ramlibacter sp.]|nr:hypothetical protein [Ramlibacter sp.]
MRAPTQVRQAFSSPDWLYEIKFDGYRCMAGIEDGQAELRTKSGANCTHWYPEVAEVLATLPGGPHVIDGEACVLDEWGRSDFNRLEARSKRRKWYAGADQVTLCAFDLLVLDGQRVIDRPLTQRKALLRELLARLPKAEVMYVGDLDADAGLFNQVVMQLKLEGFMAKRRASRYQPGVVSEDWLKIKRPGWQEGRRWKGKKAG